MRPDMSKVIVEKPRLGSNHRIKRRFHRFDPKRVDTDETAVSRLPGRIGHSRAVALASWHKMLNENLSPLRRYLKGQIGRPWSKVWSELSQHVRADNIVQQHVRDHVQDFVAYRTFERGGVIFLQQRFGGPVALDRADWPEMYVDPRHGLLCRNKRCGTSKRRREARERLRREEIGRRMRVIDEKRQLHLLADGNWWEVELASDRAAHGRHPGHPLHLARHGGNPVDVVIGAGLSQLPRETLYDRHGVYAARKRPLSSREIRRLKLRS